jgi:predicted Fe-S protein YdhL (DUF1289 family)
MFAGESSTLAPALAAMATISSPCTKVCTIDPRSKLCIGCSRSLQEIGNWSRLSEGERLRIMAELPQRVASASPRAPARAADGG